MAINMTRRANMQDCEGAAWMGLMEAISIQKRYPSSELWWEKTTQSADLFNVSEFVGVNEKEAVYL
jgi:hypothetical protein